MHFTSMVIGFGRTTLTALAALVLSLLLAFPVTATPPPPHRPSPPEQSPTSQWHPPPPPPIHPPPSSTAPKNNQWSAPPPPRKQMKRPPPLPNSHPGNRPKTKKRRGLNLGNKVGLSFAGIAVIMQFVVIGFLIYKKKQLCNVRD